MGPPPLARDRSGHELRVGFSSTVETLLIEPSPAVEEVVERSIHAADYGSLAISPELDSGAHLASDDMATAADDDMATSGASPAVTAGDVDVDVGGVVISGASPAVVAPPPTHPPPSR